MSIALLGHSGMILDTLGGNPNSSHNDKHYFLPFSTVLKPKSFSGVHPELIFFTQNV
jgi:hypothetical protein